MSDIYFQWVLLIAVVALFGISVRVREYRRRERSSLNDGLLCASLSLFVLLLTGCSGVTQSVVVHPGAGAQTALVGQTVQFTAVATSQMGSAVPTTGNVTNSAVWTSSIPAVATINASGLATAVGSGATQISAESGGVVGLSNLTVTGPSTTSSNASLTVIPAPGLAQTTFVGETTQFLAIGNLDGTGVVQDLTNRVHWLSSDVSVATIAQSGLATGVNANQQIKVSTDIIAIGTTSAGSTLTATSTLTSLPSGGTVTLPTLTLYKVGLGSGTVTSSPAGLLCGTQASCTGNFVLGSLVTLTAAPAEGSSFAGWSSNCMPTSSGSLTCDLTMHNNETVGVIFNTP